MKSRKISATKKGSLLIELAVAIAISSITFTALSSLIVVRQARMFDLLQRRQALFSAVSEMEKARSSVSGNIRSVMPCVRRAESEALWNTAGINKKISFGVLIPNTAYAKNIDGDCGGDVLDFSAFTSKPPSISSVQISNLPRSVDALKNIAAVGTRSPAAPEIQIYDISGATPSLLSALPMQKGVNAIDLTQKRIYVASDGPDSQFSIIDISQPSNPKITAVIPLPEVAGSYPNATSISYYGKKVYIGTHRTAGDEFHIFDVSGENPAWLGSLELNHNINAIAVMEPYAYLATSGNSENLIILDVSDPNAPREVSSLAFSGKEDSISIFLSDNEVYIGRKKSAKNSEPDFIIVDIKNPFEPKQLGSLSLKKDITGIRLADVYALLSTASADSPLVAVDISDRANPKIASYLPADSGATSIDIENGSIFLLTEKSLGKITPSS